MEELESACFRFKVREINGVPTLLIAPKDKCDNKVEKPDFRKELKMLTLAHNVQKIKLVEDLNAE